MAIHKVRSGETIYDIIHEFYGIYPYHDQDPIRQKLAELESTNSSQLTSLAVGQEIILPEPEQPPVDDGQPPVDDGQPPVDDGQPPANETHPTAKKHRK
jgi:hypothetical protein